MPAALPLSSSISQSSQADRQYRVLKNQFGNGYSERAGDGINTIVDTWNVSWDNVNATDYGTIMTALDSAKGVDYFTWTAPGDSSSKKWIVAKVTRRMFAGSVFSVTATLDQVFDL
jgi:phage-related protein